MIEAAVHAARFAFELEENEAILLVDATNAFNVLNCQVALHNIRRLCLPIATMLSTHTGAPLICWWMEMSSCPKKAPHRVTL